MRKYSFRTRLFAAMLAASLIPLCICSAMIVGITRLRMEDNARAEAAEQSAGLLQGLDFFSDALTTAAGELNDNDTVIHNLASGSGSRLQMNSILFDATDTFRNYAVFDLYDLSGTCRYSTRGALSGRLPTDWGVLHGAAAAQGAAVYYSSEDTTDTSSPLLFGAVALNHGDGFSGYLVMRVYLAGFHALLDGRFPQSDILVLNPYFHPIYSSQSYLNQSLAPLLRQQLLRGESMNDGDYRYTINRHIPTGLFLVLRQPQVFSERTMNLLYTAVVICALVCVIISVLVSLSLSRQVSYPLQRLQNAFDQIGQDDLETQLPEEGSAELGQLTRRFNRMVAALKSNREELLRNQQELNEAQIRMLQAQLNPHFLCNTLDTMKWISKINKVPQVALMSTNLADILRFCISAGEFVPLYQEMDILERYIEIQKIRLSDDFAFQIHIPEELYDCMVPKMILQPIVENAILHGLNGVSGSTICVSAEEVGGGKLRLAVTDNGKGFPPEMWGHPYRRDKDLAKGHLGLYNVDTILRRNFGDDCGLTLNCGEGGMGACVAAILPIRYEEETEC